MDLEVQTLDSFYFPSVDNNFDLEIEESVESDNNFEDDAEEEVHVKIGILRKPKDSKMLLRHLFPSKAGGVPAWLDPKHLPGEKSRICGFCSAPLTFVLQIYAPEKEEHAFHRMLYVFMCSSLSCLRKDQEVQLKSNEVDARRSVKVFRCQLPCFNLYYSSEPPKHDGSDKPLTAGAVLCSWCGTWLGNKICSNCRTTRYCSKVHQALHWRVDHKLVCSQVVDSSNASTILNNGIRNKPVGKNSAVYQILFEEHEIVIEEECPLDSESDEDLSSTNTLANDDESFEYFKERTNRNHEQVLRYCRDLAAKPLWPLLSGRPTVADIPNCSYCRGPMCYEFQILPQFLAKIGAEADYDSPDWATIVVYTCLASCNSSLSYISEFAWVQLFPAGWGL